MKDKRPKNETITAICFTVTAMVVHSARGERNRNNLVDSEKNESKLRTEQGGGELRG